MIRSILAALLASTAASHAATVAVGPADDAAFRDLCRGCETAVAEIRGGGPGEWELDARAASGPDARGQTDFAIASARAYAFHVVYAADTDTLALGAGSQGAPLAYDWIALDAAQAARFGQTTSLMVRARARDWAGGVEHGATRLTDLTLDGRALGDLEAVDGASYLAVSGFDFTRSFEITGAFRFDYAGTRPRSHHAAQFKFTDLEVAPIPVPAAGLMLLGALGALGAARLRRG